MTLIDLLSDLRFRMRTLKKRGDCVRLDFILSQTMMPLSPCTSGVGMPHRVSLTYPLVSCRAGFNFPGLTSQPTQSRPTFHDQQSNALPVRQM